MTSVRRLFSQLLLWAAPLGVGLAIVLIVSQARWFTSGPGTPTAGDPRAWDAIWGAVVLVGGGCAVGGAATLLWLLFAWRRRRRPTALEGFRTVLSLLLALGACWIWFAR